MDSKLVRSSKLLSLVLRHRPETLGLTLDPSGWVSVPTLLSAAQAHGHLIDHDLLLRIVHENDKQRFSLSEDGLRIRANQGHSVSVELGLLPTTPPERLFHGTVDRFLLSIRSQGLIPGSRQHVHLSADRQTAEIVARRRGTPVILGVDSLEMFRAGHSFYLSSNGVWLTNLVPAEFLTFPAKT